MSKEINLFMKDFDIVSFFTKNKERLDDIRERVLLKNPDCDKIERDGTNSFQYYYFDLLNLKIKHKEYRDSIEDLIRYNMGNFFFSLNGKNGIARVAEDITTYFLKKFDPLLKNPLVLIDDYDLAVFKWYRGYIWNQLDNKDNIKNNKLVFTLDDVEEEGKKKEKVFSIVEVKMLSYAFHLYMKARKKIKQLKNTDEDFQSWISAMEYTVNFIARILQRDRRKKLPKIDIDISPYDGIIRIGNKLIDNPEEYKKYMAENYYYDPAYLLETFVMLNIDRVFNTPLDSWENTRDNILTEDHEEDG